MTTTELIAKAPLQPVAKARNLDAIGWWDGYMLVKYRGRSQMYVFGPQIPEAERDKILANPYPDRLFSLVIQKKFRCHKIGGK